MKRKQTPEQKQRQYKDYRSLFKKSHYVVRGPKPPDPTEIEAEEPEEDPKAVRHGFFDEWYFV